MVTGHVFLGKPRSLLMLQVITQNNNNLGSTAEHFKPSGASQGRVMERWLPGHPTPRKAMVLGEGISGSELILMELSSPPKSNGATRTVTTLHEPLKSALELKKEKPQLLHATVVLSNLS